MNKAILATKVGMTQIFNEDGSLYHNIHCHCDFSLQNCRMAVINASFSP